jgi:hypothetical protein
VYAERYDEKQNPYTEIVRKYGVIEKKGLALYTVPYSEKKRSFRELEGVTIVEREREGVKKETLSRIAEAEII